MAKDNFWIHTTLSILTQKSLNDKVNTFRIDPQFCPQLPSENQTITNPPLGCVGMYSIFFKSGLCLPYFLFLRIVLDYYEIHIAQVTPNGF